MKPTLNLHMGQSLTMTPQLQQAIRLLQLSTLDLRQEIQQAIENNPLLELDETFSEDAPNDDDGATEELTTDRDDALEELVDGDFSEDAEWDDIYAGNSTPSSSSTDEMSDWQQQQAADNTLQDHLHWQLNLTPMSDSDRVIAMALIESVDERGYLTSSLDDLLDTLNTETLSAEDTPIEADEVLAVQHRLQHFDPLGVVSFNLAECLTVQLNVLADDTPNKAIASALLSQPQLIEKQDFTTLRRTLSLSEAEITCGLELLRTLNPAPGEHIGTQDDDHVVPDVIVRLHKGRWTAMLNEALLPKVSLHQQYAKLARSSSGTDGQYLKNCMQEAKWFIKSLQSRHDTLLKVASKILEVQQDFFNYGEEAMKPLVLADIADAVEMHESTISRVTNQKYMLTPKGVFELKYFFSSHVATEGGGECSSTAIRAIIKKLVAAENPQKPLSDNKLATQLNEQGINVARRTVAKYREAMRIPSSSERKRLL